MSAMKLRSQVSAEEKTEKQAKVPKLRQDQLPVLKYNGKIHYATTFVDCALFCDKLLNFVETNAENVIPLGFDMEWPFTFQTGPGKTALVQMAPDLNDCYLLQMSAITKLPAALPALLSHSKVRLVGVNIKNDIRKFGRDFNVNVDQMIENCIDVGVLVGLALDMKRRWSMADLVERFFEKQIIKDKKVRNSKWHEYPLSIEQKKYAAIDAFASLELYTTVEELRIKKENAENTTTNAI